ncbi:LysM peptidoglycan-binding domain-containing protein [Actinomadura sp. DC4]|uniref:LysM peptidoglycan-binding domain-containing protein n=1 Tax=Actinomadura sp. DC4 TaxID=3055069 RepID=UPI0025B0E97B|nr:LysM peptidoglycan-binding domain-containing protein [Actinomadura sp. DC4]MDN3351814.1 LysM peptidoglycan-binding domain-containing protein [Actinomadura sp. DC4]
MTPPKKPPPPPPEFVTVTRWDTPHSSLWKIAEEQFEDGTKWRDIYEANRDLIGDDPGKLRVGMRLRMPTTEVHPAYIRSVAGGLDEESATITAKILAAEQRLSEIGNFWGNDDVGTKFYRGADGKPGYQTVSTETETAVGAFGQFYKNVADRLRAMADRHDVTEWENTIQVLSVALKALDK